MRTNNAIIRLATAAAAALLAAAMATSCDMLESHPYDTRVDGPTGLTERHVRQIESRMAGRRRMRFAHISDTQRWYDETRDAVRHINAHNARLAAEVSAGRMTEAEADSLAIDFVVHSGDFTDFGMTDEFLWQRDILEGFTMPWVGVIGNHDCVANGEDVYRRVFGPTNYAFTAGNVRFLMLNTNALEYDRSQPVPDMAFIYGQLQALGIDPAAPDSATEPAVGGIEKTVIVMHAGPDSEVFDTNLSDVFELLLQYFPGLQGCLYGHWHHYTATDMFGDGVTYIQCPNIGKRQYLLFTLTEEDFTHELVDF